MAKRFSQLGCLAVIVTIASLATAAQDIDLALGGADQIWKGTQPNAAAGLSLDQGAVSPDSRRDLIVGAPGDASIAGAVYVIFGGPIRSGELLLSSAETVITSSEAGNRFGFATAAGNILNAEGTTPRNLVVGAPGASGGRGAVYLFSGGFNTGTSTTDANATLRILGASGDQLGTSLATGDLDNDTYREILIGAPGTNRVYIIKGGPSLSGTIDLSTTAAAGVINAPGLGSVMAAGDITNDNISDLILGAPSVNTVYVFNGQNGSLPSAAAGSFVGIDPGDGFGKALRIFDMDADGKRDLMMTAPDADGPGNGRANAGEAYVFYGPVNTTGGHSAAEAAVTFYGAAANDRLGEMLSAGDINRDIPNDLVMLSPGGSSGAGILEIYYGRTRSTTGTVSGTTRVVDFAAAGQVSRRIIGDPATGPIQTAQVFEVTGEGARDIIVGVPSAEGGAGKLYFTISPKLRVTPTSISFFVNEGSTGTSPTSISVVNASTVDIAYTATSNQPWLTTSATALTADNTHPATVSVVGNASGLTPGAYTGKITVASASPDLEMSSPVNVTMTVTGTRLAIDAPANGTAVPSPFSVAGWAVDVASSAGTGVDTLSVYAYPNPGSGAAPLFVGTATYGSARSDIGGLYGARFTNSGYSLSVNSLPVGQYQIVVFAHSTVSNTFANSASTTVNVTTAGTEPLPAPTPPPAPGPTPGPGPTPTPGPDTRVSLNRSALYFGATQNGALMTPEQVVRVNFANGASTWTATTSASWLEIASGSGSGAGTFIVRVKPGTYSAGLVQTANVTVTAAGVANSPLTLPITFRSMASGTNPSGVVDTPADNITGVVGALPFTGWAIDDIEVKKVTIWRDGVGAEGSGLVFIGNGTFVDGARPDVEASSGTPLNYRAGWGLLILTNMLPNQGNGTFRIHAVAEDAEGHSVLLGSRTVTCDNAHSTKPFGTIDTPEQGGTASGNAYVNFGWVLAPSPHRIPTDGSTIMVYIDGVPVGRPTYNQNRSDIATLFPGLANSNGAIGYFTIDTTTLANGVHTIAWGVTDEAGTPEGLGSRYFTVFNGSTSSALTVAPEVSVQTLTTGAADVRQEATTGMDAGTPAVALQSLPASDTPAYVRSGFDSSAPLTLVDTDSRGVTAVSGTELGRLELTLGAPVSDDGRYEGYLVSGGRLSALPNGAFLDRQGGSFFWQPGVGYVGSYEFLFVRTEGGVRERIPVTVTIRPN